MVFVFGNKSARAAQRVLKHKELPIAAVVRTSGLSAENQAIARESIGYGADTTRTGRTMQIGTQGNLGFVYFGFDWSLIPAAAEIRDATLTVRGGKATPSGSYPSYARARMGLMGSGTSATLLGDWAQFTQTAGQTLSVHTTDDYGRAQAESLILDVDLCGYGGHLDGATMDVWYYVYE